MRRVYLVKYILYISLLNLIPLSVQASLPQDIDQYFRHVHGKQNTVSIEIKTPIDKWPKCDKPQISPPSGAEIWAMSPYPYSATKKNNIFN
ncbi:Uncharacterised protein [Providencia rustigianii]|nr:Uncharacterised protein [Providencia rustigianii]